MVVSNSQQTIVGDSELVKGVPLDETHPHLVAEWHEDNPHISTFSKGTVRSAKWRCQQGHVWTAPPNRRAHPQRPSGCPYCTGRRPIVGVNDLLTLRPDIAEQWHPDNDYGPDSVLLYSNRKIKWVCDYGHVWVSALSNRTSNGSGCPECATQRTSRIEIDVLCSLSRYGAVRSRAKIEDVEVDIWLPSHNLAVQYDGLHWHKDRTVFDKERSLRILSSGCRLHRLREFELTFLGDIHANYSESQFGWSRSTEAVDQQIDACLGSTLSMPKSR